MSQPIPILVCYYCVRDNHARCAILKTCACWTCHAPAAHEHAAQAGEYRRELAR